MSKLRIQKIEIYQLKPTLIDKPFVVKPVIIRMITNNNIDGFGEAGISAGLGSYAVFAMLKEMVPQLIGIDPYTYDQVFEKFNTSMYGHVSGGGAIFYSALSAINIALMDIVGKDKKVPIYQLLDNKKRDKVRCYASQVQDGWKELDKVYTLDQYQEAGKLLIKDGMKAVKFNFHFHDEEGNRLSRDITTNAQSINYLTNLVDKRLSIFRKTVGNDFDIISESLNNLSYDTSKAIDEILTKYNVLFAEEYYFPYEFDNYLRAKDSFKTPLASGEKLQNLLSFKPYFENECMQVCQVDVSMCGGLSEAYKICKLADTYKIKVQAHLCGTTIACAATLQLEAVINNFYYHEHINQLNSKEVLDYCDKKFDVINGEITIPDDYGLGVRLTDKTMKEAIDKFAIGE